MNDLVVITGQTATGKTKLALNYALKQNGELINADSRQVYKYLDIVTGKDKDELKKSGIKVHLLDVVTPDQPFSSHDFVKATEPIIQDIWERKKTPIIVGGTYLYIKHLLYGQDIKIPPNQKLRISLEKLSVDELQKKLLSIDKKSFLSLNNSDSHNPRRLIRKIEIASASMKSIKLASAGKGYKLQATSYKIIGLKHKNKESLIKTITERVEKRLQQGALEEAKQLLKKGYKNSDHGLQTIGYKQLIAHLDGNITLEQAKQDWINKEVQYAKRQYTFMKKNKNIFWSSC